MHFIQQTKAFHLRIECAVCMVCVSIGVAWSLRLNYDPSFRLSHGYKRITYIAKKGKKRHRERKKPEEDWSHPWRDYLNWLHIGFSVPRNIDHTVLVHAPFSPHSFHRYESTDCGIHSLSHTLSFSLLLFHWSLFLLLLISVYGSASLLLCNVESTNGSKQLKRRVKEFN